MNLPSNNYFSPPFFEKITKNQNMVLSLKNTSEYYYQVKMKTMKTLNVLVYDAYTVGEADIYEILKDYPDVNIIMVLSNWNSYTMEAKYAAIDNKVGLFFPKDYLGALNKAEYWKYYYGVDEDGNKLYRTHGGY